MVDRAEPTSVDPAERLRPERFVAGGEAIARDSTGRVVFVRGGLPGDEVTVAATDDKGDWWRGRVTEIHVAGPDRVEAPCARRRSGCGGCDWQHVAVAAQLPAKAEVVRDALRRTGRLPDADVTLGRAVEPTGYRTTMRVVGDHAGGPAFRVERSHETVPSSGCLVAHPSLAELLDALWITPGLDVTLRISAATGEATARWDQRKGEVLGLPEHVRVGATATLSEDVDGHRLRVSAASFFQSGPAAAALLVDAVRRAAPELADARTVLDAYAGVGLFAVTTTSPPTGVITVETSRSAVADCRANLTGREARVEHREVGSWRPASGVRIDAAIADPARSGLGRPGVGTIDASGAPVLALVSCDPVALARDAALLARRGFRHAGTEVLDVFPHTHHVECVTRFERR